MPYTEDEINYLTQGLASPADVSSSVEPPEETGGLIKRGKQIANLVPASLNVFGRKLAEVSQFVNPEYNLSEGTKEAANFFPKFETGPNAGLTDVLLNDVLPEMPATAAEFLIPYSGVSKAAKFVGGAGRLSSIIAEGLGQGVASAGVLPDLGKNLAQESTHGGKSLADYVKTPEVDPATAGAFGFVSGALQEGLRPAQRVIPLTLASALYYAKTKDIVGAIGNVVGNMFPGAFKAEAQAVTKPRLNPSVFDSILNPEAKTFNAGEGGQFNFVEGPLKEAPLAGPLKEPLREDLLNRPLKEIVQEPHATPEILQYQTLDELKGYRLNREPTQLEINLESPNAPVSRRATGLDYEPLQTPPDIVPREAPDIGLKLEGQQYRDQPLSPLIELQSQGRGPGPSAPSMFSLMDEVASRPIDTTGNLLEWNKNPVATVIETPHVQSDLFSSVEKPPVSKPEVVTPKDLSPALWDKVDEEVLAQGPRGVTEHKTIKNEAMDKLAGKREDFDPFGDIVHGFLDENGNRLSRVEAGKIAIDNGFLNESGLAKVELAKKQGKEFSLDSQDLKVAEPVPDLESAKVLDSKIQELQQDAAFARDQGQILHAESIERVITKMQQEGIDAATGMKRGGAAAGKISPETAIVLGAAGLTGLIAYKESEGDVGTTLAAGLIAAGLSLAGVKSFKALKELTGPEAKILKTKIPDAKITEKVKQFAKNTARTPGGAAVMGRGGLWAGAVRMAEGMANLGVSPLFRDKKILAEGFISDQLEVLQKSIDDVKGVEPSTGFSEASAKFLRGQLADKVDVQRVISGGGGKTGDEWAKLTAQQKKAFPEKWIVMDNPNSTNTKGPGVTVYHVTNATKDTLNQLQKTALKAQAVTAADKEFMQLPMQARKTIDNMMGVIHAAVPPGERLNRILGTMGQYASRTHELLTNPKHYPSEVEIQNAMDRLASSKEDRFLESLPVNSTGPNVITHKGKTYSVSPAIADEFQNLHTPEAMRSLVTQYIKEIKQNAAGAKLGIISKDTEQLGSSIFSGRKELDEVTQALLGTHEAPLELIQNTINRLVPSARAAHFMKSMLDLMDSSTGLKMAYRTDLEYNKAINALRDAMNDPAVKANPRMLQDVQTRYQELSSYIPVSGQKPKMGLFQGAYVSRGAYDQLAGFDNPFGILDNSIGRGLSAFNQVIKETHLVANPIVHVRNMFQIPFFLAMGNAAATPAAWKTAYTAMKDPLSSVGRRLAQNGVFIGNVIQGEFNHGLTDLLNGKADKTIWDQLKKGRMAAHQLYAAPDNFVRASVYLAEEARAAKKFGVSVDAADPRVMEQARQFMSKRTMDYANVPQWVKTGRQIPLVSMFLSYTHEIIRIAANTANDALHGDLQAGAALAGISAMPFLLQSNAENQLSPADLKEWNKVKNVSQDYSRPRFKLPMSRNSNGTFNYVDITPIFPFNDFQIMIRAAAKGDAESVVATNPFVGLEKTPILSMLSEQITGKERHTAKEFRDGWDRTMSIVKQLAPPHTPGIGTEYMKDMPESLGGTLGQTNLKTGRTNTIKGALLRHAIGIDYTQVNPSIATSNYIKSAQHEIANERQYMRDVMLKEGISKEAKQRAQRRFVEAVHSISENLQTHLDYAK